MVGNCQWPAVILHFAHTHTHTHTHTRTFTLIIGTVIHWEAIRSTLPECPTGPEEGQTFTGGDLNAAGSSGGPLHWS